jgi:hypothetical protein
MSRRNHKARILDVAVLAGVLAAASTAASAFPFGYSWHDPANGGTQAPDTPKGRAGAGGIYYTGGQRDYGMTCAVCHIKAEGKITASVKANPPFQKKNGDDAFEPGQPYTITIDLLNEHKLPGGTVVHTLNGFNATIEDPSGQVQGVLGGDVPGNSASNCPATFPTPAPTTGTSFVYGDCKAVVYVPKNDSTSWTFKWTAPSAASVTEVTLYYSVVDGDHPDKSSLDDDVYSNKMKLVRF